jgi:glycosyltransferase involved in cell wall biosynthesis
MHQPAVIKIDVPAAAAPEVPGRLDGATLLRFAHAYETGGGMERYLDDVDEALLSRNAMTIIRIYLAQDRHQLAERVDQSGRGRLVRVPLALPEGESLQQAQSAESHAESWKHRIRDGILYSKPVWNLLTRPILLRRSIPRSQGQAVGAGAKVADLMKRHRIDLIMLHFIGGADSDEIVDQARLAGVPFAVANHYANDRFLHLSIRKHACLAAGVGGVNGLGLPEYVRDRFFNLSDGIDTEFFSCAQAAAERAAPPLVILPARIVRAKGQMDLVQAAGVLQSRGVDFRVAFAGRTDSGAFLDELRREIERKGLQDRVIFPGELSVTQLRQWYAASSVMAFPTYHHEGLPRIMMEAQAMKVPVVAYGTGGVAEGLLPDRTGYLLKTGDIAGLAARLEELLRQPDLRVKMGEAGRQLVEQRFSLGALARRHEEFYAGLIHRK